MIPSPAYCERRFSVLHPKFAATFLRLHNHLIASYEARETQTRFEVYETFRSSVRQDHLFALGTTKARAGQSPHNFGLAVDFVPRVPDEHGKLEWSWGLNHDWSFLKRSAEIFGFETIVWDKPHVQVMNWKAYKK